MHVSDLLRKCDDSLYINLINLMCVQVIEAHIHNVILYYEWISNIISTIDGDSFIWMKSLHANVTQWIQLELINVKLAVAVFYKYIMCFCDKWIFNIINKNNFNNNNNKIKY